jgi:hypothetical protein
VVWPASSQLARSSPIAAVVLAACTIAYGRAFTSFLDDVLAGLASHGPLATQRARYVRALQFEHGVAGELCTFGALPWLLRVFARLSGAGRAEAFRERQRHARPVVGYSLLCTAALLGFLAWLITRAWSGTWRSPSFRADDIVGDPGIQGGNLSGGQWQRVGLARAFGHATGGVLLLDEPSAALDPAAEARFFRTALDQARGRTILLATHHLANTRFADRIVVLDGGRIVEEGGHADLMRHGGLYADMFTAQARSYGVEP